MTSVLVFVLTFAVQNRWFPIGSMNVVGNDCTVCWDRACRCGHLSFHFNPTLKDW